MPPKSKTALAVRTPKWEFVYRVDNERGRAIYVGRTLNERDRASAHQREASKCVRLAHAIRDLKERHATWTFSKSFRRVDGLRNGLPEIEAAKFEAYFIWCIDGHGTQHTLQNPSGCNMREGDNALQHQAYFAEIEESLDSLGPDEDLFSAEDRVACLSACHADVSFVEDVQAGFVEANIPIPECVNESYDLCVRRCDVATNLAQTHIQVRALKALGKRKLDSGNLAFAKEWNALGDLINNYVPDPANQSQVMMHRLTSKLHFSVRALTSNGEAHASASCIDSNLVTFFAQQIELALKQRDDAGGVPTRSLQSMLAWCLPNSKLISNDNSNASKLRRIEGLLRGSAGVLNDQQIEMVQRRKADILNAVELSSPLVEPTAEAGKQRYIEAVDKATAPKIEYSEQQACAAITHVVGLRVQSCTGVPSESCQLVGQQLSTKRNGFQTASKGKDNCFCGKKSAAEACHFEFKDFMAQLKVLAPKAWGYWAKKAGTVQALQRALGIEECTIPQKKLGGKSLNNVIFGFRLIPTGMNNVDGTPFGKIESDDGSITAHEAEEADDSMTGNMSTRFP